MTGSSGPVADQAANNTAAELSVLQQISRQLLHEQRSSRRWNIFFRVVFVVLSLLFLVLSYIGISVVFMLIDTDGPAAVSVSNGPHTAVVRIKGEISDDSAASAKNLIEALRNAVADRNTKGIILLASSNGGSPVQAAYVYDEIRRLKQRYPYIRIVTVIAEGCFSACYYIAAASDEIYANRNSLVGSIGVVYEGFGYDGLMQKLGVQRRILKAGRHKDYLDSFSPLNPEHSRHHRRLLSHVLDEFIRDVKNGRKNRLKKDAPEIFSGLIWDAKQARTLGLIDDLGDTFEVAKMFGAQKLVDFTVRESLLKQLVRNFGASLGRQLLDPRSGRTLRLR